MNIQNTSKLYKPEFKEAAVKLAIESRNPVSQTARDLGVKPKTLHNWINLNAQRQDVNMQSTKNMCEEIKRLKKELAQVTVERDILKKATAYFAKESR